MVDFNGIVGKVKDAVSKNPDAVRSGLGKVEAAINQRTGDKYADKLAQGRGNLEGAIGVPGQAKDAYTQGRDGEQYQAEPVDAPEPVDRPGPIDENR